LFQHVKVLLEPAPARGRHHDDRLRSTALGRPIRGHQPRFFKDR
jgi:hypothetical protein